MTQLEQLTAIISQARREMRGVYASAGDIDRAIAERLIEKGVVLPPCKVGDTLYYIPFGNNIFEYKVAQIVIEPFEQIGMSLRCYGGLSFDMSYIGKTVFLTRKEAEEALKQGARDEQAL